MSYETDEDLFNATTKDYSYNDTTLYWCGEDTKTCHICGSPDHIAKICGRNNRNNNNPKENKMKKLYSKFRLTQHRKLPKSYAEVAKDKNISKQHINNGDEQNTLKNGTTSGGSMHEKKNPELHSILSEIQKSLKILTSQVDVSSDDTINPDNKSEKELQKETQSIKNTQDKLIQGINEMQTQLKDVLEVYGNPNPNNNDNEYSKYVQKAIGYQGRVIYLDLFMKGHIKLRIIQVYLQANFTGNKKEITDLHHYIITLIDQGKKNNYKLIIMGDFNLSPERYKEEYHTRQRYHWKYNILNKLYGSPTQNNEHHDIRNLNHYWNLIHEGIMKAAIKIIPNHMTPTQHKERKYIITTTTIEDIRKKITLFHKTLIIKTDLLNKKWNEEQIKKFVRQRCENYKDNQIEIKYLTNKHFQTCPGGTHTQKEIPDQWKEQYTPLTAINPTIYKYLMTKPTYNEWLDVLTQLPNDKAPGPSGITNEMLKNLGSKMSECIWKFICACINLSEIPYAWREADIYPIPKPKEWECDLNNTRPITLLDTTRKAMVRLLNNRLAKIMVKHKIHLSSTAPNAILENNFIFKYRDLYEVQLQAKITNFCIQINDKNLLGKITNIRLKQLQQQEWLSYSPLHEWPYKHLGKKFSKKFIASMISLCKIHEISFQVMKQDMNIIQGGKLHIRQFLGKGFHKFKKQLQKHSIMFIDQLSSIDGIFLNEWKTITEKSFTTHNRVTRVPQWFKIIENQILQTPDISRRIQPSYIYPATHFKGSTITIPNINTQSKEWS
ncbi:6198_t:CDS:2 [Entrophospora sp. SA101]|nr:6198_t:CDS:2 [Entrophospora sp. SA101]